MNSYALYEEYREIKPEIMCTNVPDEHGTQIVHMFYLSKAAQVWDSSCRRSSMPDRSTTSPQGLERRRVRGKRKAFNCFRVF